ncbi:hypothetical protein HLV35_06095 [Eggerthellaceae bacterium zg-997]|nr:hypothetical protein [Eggerthellaceae bacterium zg-997]
MIDVVYPSKKRYDKETLLKVSVAFNRNTDPELTRFIESKESRAEYLRELAREDFRRNVK